MDRRELYFYFEPFEVIKDISCKPVEIIDYRWYRWYYEHDKSRENSKILLKGII